MKKSNRMKLAVLGGLLASSVSVSAFASCSDLPSHAQLKAAIDQASSEDASGLNLNMWGTIVDRDGIVCAVAHTGSDRGAQWPGSRVISAQKANTANAFSLDGLSISTGNLYGPSQGTSNVTPLGGSLYGLQFSNPVNPLTAYAGNSALIGTANDPMKRRKIGGVNVFGGGLALYNAQGDVVGAIGMSGDTSCADHNQAWRARHILALDYVPGGPAAAFYPANPYNLSHPDTIIYDGINGDGNGITDGFEQPPCANMTDVEEVQWTDYLPEVRLVVPADPAG